MSTNSLAVTVEATHQSLQRRLETATTSGVRRSRPRERQARTDAFLSATARHLAAAEEVLVPEARRRLGDEELVRAYLHQARLLEMSLAELKARSYGQVAAAHLPLAHVWDGVKAELTRHNDLERELVERLTEDLDGEQCAGLARRLYEAELRAPTRAHPYLPHRGFLGLAARRVWALADRFWDTAEGRQVPKPVVPPAKDHSHDSLIAQYLVGEPRFDSAAPVIAHRRRHT